jgi:1-acyl-sn-glycerol-3-phosphate acyltransferase
MKKLLSSFRKTGFVLSCILAVASVFLFFRIPRNRGIIEEVCLEKNFSWSKGKRIFVSNHPSWLDQLLSTALRLPYWSVDLLPYIAVANDSIKRSRFLRFLDAFSFLTPIERKGNSSMASGHIRKMQALLNNGFNLMMAGAPGRDFRGTEGEAIYSPLKKKPLRKFTELCGLLAILPGIETVPFCIDGTHEFYRQVEINGRQEMEFSPWKFFVMFWLLGKIKIKIIYGQPLGLEGKSRAEATSIIQESVLNLLDIC